MSTSSAGIAYLGPAGGTSATSLWRSSWVPTPIMTEASQSAKLDRQPAFKVVGPKHHCLTLACAFPLSPCLLVNPCHSLVATPSPAAWRRHIVRAPPAPTLLLVPLGVWLPAGASGPTGRPEDVELSGVDAAPLADADRERRLLDVFPR